MYRPHSLEYFQSWCSGDSLFLWTAPSAALLLSRCLLCSLPIFVIKLWIWSLIFYKFMSFDICAMLLTLYLLIQFTVPFFHQCNILLWICCFTLLYSVLVFSILYLTYRVFYFNPCQLYSRFLFTFSRTKILLLQFF